MQLSDKQVHDWAIETQGADPRWAFGISHFEGCDWLIGYRSEMSFPMFRLDGCKNLEREFQKFFKSDQWKMLVWLVGDHKERFEEAYLRLKRAGGDARDSDSG